MRSPALLDSLVSLEPLDLRLSPSALSLSPAILASCVYHSNVYHPLDDDPIPDPEPSPGPYPGNDPPITHPELPPTGPVGPGSSL
jgi:hypothetical protein